MSVFPSITRRLIGLAVCFVAIVGLALLVYSPSSGLLTVAFLDVGQGDAIFIETPSGTQILLDAGINARILEALDEVMPFYDRTIDVAVLSHPDADHIGGFPDVLSGYRIAHVIRGSIFEENDISAEISQRSEAVQRHEVSAGDIVVLDAAYGVTLEVLHPSEMFSGVDSNDSSVVARLMYGDVEFMLTGDASARIETYLAGTHVQRLTSDVLKVGHHGSKTSSSEIFLGQVQPRYAVISAGADNRYGHPHQKVVDRLISFGAEILQTSESGTITMQSDGVDVWVVH